MTDRRDPRQPPGPEDPRYAELCAAIRERLGGGRGVRRRLPDWGRIVADRNPRFLGVYRRVPPGDQPEMESLVKGEASYLTAPGERKHRRGVGSLVRTVAEVAQEAFGAFLVVEIWAGAAVHGPRRAEDEARPRAPAFRLVVPRDSAMRTTVEAFELALGKIVLARQPATVERIVASVPSPPGLRPLLPAAELASLNTHVIGVEINPIFRDPATGAPFPLLLRDLRRRFARALKQGAFEFTRRMTTRTPVHYEALGRRAVVKAVWEVDRQLAEVGGAFDLMLAITPVNRARAWSRFRRQRFERHPEFLYRPITVEPELLKRRLFRVPIERIEDPVLAQLFREQQREIDRRLSLLRDRGTRAFLYGSLQLHGAPDADLLQTAQDVLRRTSTRERAGAGDARVGATALFERATRELESYRAIHPEMRGRAEIREDVDGLMVSRGTLLIGRSLDVPAERVEALVQHEVGTHVVTYANGQAQPLALMHTGMPGYDELQEGIAVLAEHLVGGLSAARLRTLAARVIACAGVVEGATFIDTFRALSGELGFSQPLAFAIATRVHRSGGIVKDAVYLRGLVRLLHHIAAGGSLEDLLAGKISFEHAPLVRELQLRGVLKPAAVRPRYLDDPAAVRRLAQLRRPGVALLDLVQAKKGSR